MLLVLAQSTASLQITEIENEVVLDNLLWAPAGGDVDNRKHFRLALTRALRIISRYCTFDFDRILSRVAPLEFKALGADVLMQTHAMFVLEESVWVPMALSIERETDNTRMLELLGAAEYDIKITVNTEIDLVIGDRSCGWVDEIGTTGHYSATTILLHELLHGLGIYSLVSKQTGGALMGLPSHETNG